MGIAPSSELEIETESQWSVNGSEFILEKLVGSQAFFSLYVDVDDKNSSVHVLKVNSCSSYVNYNIVDHVMCHVTSSLSKD